jgi:hypothetical protein
MGRSGSGSGTARLKPLADGFGNCGLAGLQEEAGRDLAPSPRGRECLPECAAIAATAESPASAMRSGRRRTGPPSSSTPHQDDDAPPFGR